MDRKKCAIGVDLGGTKIAMGAVDGEGSVLRLLRYETDVSGGPSAVMGQIARGVAQLKRDGALPVVGMGIGVAGQVDPETGSVRFAPNLDWRDVSLRACLEESTGAPVTVVNDVRAALWGEWLFGAGRGFDHLICAFVGTGVGGGIVSSGQVLDGCTNTAGEIGHMTVDLQGPVCHCGNQGCLEALAGGWGIERKAREMVKARPGFGSVILKEAGGGVEKITARDVVEAYRQGDALAREILDGAVEALAAGMAGLVNILNPCRVILGGGIVEGMPELVARVEEGIRRRSLAAALGDFAVLPSRLGKDAGVVGAAALAMRVFA